MLAEYRHGVANSADVLEIAVEPFRLVEEALFRGGKCRIESARQNKRLAKQRASHFVQVADIDERDVVVKTERSQNRHLRIVGIKPVDLVQRRLDRQRAMTIDRRSAAEIVVTLQNKELGARRGYRAPRRSSRQARSR